MFDKLLLAFAGTIIVVMISGTAYHFIQVEALEDEIAQKEKIIRLVGDDLNTAYSLLYTCEENTTKEGVQGYIDGIGDHNETTVSTLDNLTT